MNSESAPLDPISYIVLHSSLNGKNCPEPGFEGPEKRLQLDLCPLPGKEQKINAARAIPIDVWQSICNSIGAQIVDTMADECISSHLLTESSLFVSEYRIILITCGTTTLLKGLELILKEVERVNLQVEWMSYSRKNYTFPWAQKAPHSTLSEEYSILKHCFPDGQPFIFGPIDGDHYFYFTWYDIAQDTDRVESDMQLNLVMYDMCEEVSSELTSEKTLITNERTRELRSKVGFTNFIPDGSNIQDILFTPCGYSLNATECGGTYYTMHITPESHCSYASFETNKSVKNYESLVNVLLSIFRPKRFTIMVLADDKSLVGCELSARNPIGIEGNSYPSYTRSNFVMNCFGPGYSTYKVNYVRAPMSPR